MIRLLLIAALALFASGISPSVCLAQQGGILDGSLIERIERRAEKLEQALDGSNAESKAWRDRWDFFDRHPDGGRLFDGHRIVAALTWIATGLIGVYWLAWGVIVAAIVALSAVALDRLANAANSVAGIFRPQKT